MTREIYLNREADYYFFIEENFEFGYLGHPWRQEIWIFGRYAAELFCKEYDKEFSAYYGGIQKIEMH